jgi:hypothetical protein
MRSKTVDITSTAISSALFTPLLRTCIILNPHFSKHSPRLGQFQYLHCFPYCTISSSNTSRAVKKWPKEFNMGLQHPYNWCKAQACHYQHGLASALTQLHSGSPSTALHHKPCCIVWLHNCTKNCI